MVGDIHVKQRFSRLFSVVVDHKLRWKESKLQDKYENQINWSITIPEQDNRKLNLIINRDVKTVSSKSVIFRCEWTTS